MFVRAWMSARARAISAISDFALRARAVIIRHFTPRGRFTRRA